VRTVAAIPAIALLTGCALGLLIPEIPGALLIIAMITGAIAAAWTVWQRAERQFLVAIILVFAAGGARLSAHAWTRAWRPPLRLVFERLARAQRADAMAENRFVPMDDEAFATIAGTLRADAAVTPTGVSLSLDADEPAAGGVVVTIAGALAAERIGEWRAGRRVRFPAHLRRTARYLDPGVPDFERALARRGTTLVGSVKSGALVEVLARGTWVDERIAAVRAFSRRTIAAAVGRWSPRSAAIVAAIVIGDRVGLDEEVQRRLQEAGTYHVIAISGGNIAILAGLLFAGFRVAGWLGRTTSLTTIAMLIAYAKLVGGGASVDRATLMALIYFAARALDQRTPPVNALGVVAALLTAVDPLSVLDPAFTLTFGATLAILLAAPAVQALRGTAILRSAAMMLAASAATEAMLLPVGALVFSRVTFAGLGLNFLAIPLMGVAQIAGMIVVPAAVVSARAAAAVGWIAHLGALGLVESANLVRFAPLVAVRVAPPSVAVVATYYIAGAAAWCLWGRRDTRWLTRAVAAVGISAAVWITLEPWSFLTARGNGRLHATFLDVGQGDSIFVRLPRGSTLLVDTGGLSTTSAFDIGDRVVAPVLREAGVRRLDYLVLTHGDPDHIGGAASIIREFRPREVWEGIPVPRSQPLALLKAQTQGAGLGWRSVTAGQHTRIDDAEIVVGNPAAAEWERQKVRNDDSVALDLMWRDVELVLTGDIGKTVERTLTSSLRHRRLRILKVPHHGSLTSSTLEFVRAFEPQVAVISAGRGNHFGHPAPEVLGRYEEAGAEIFRTDRDGAVTIDTDGYLLNIGTDSSRRTKDTKAAGGVASNR
jgi:competence protein ComEC